MRKLFKVTDNKYNLDITKECVMDSYGDIRRSDSDDYTEFECTTFQKDHIQYPRYTVEKFI